MYRNLADIQYGGKKLGKGWGGGFGAGRACVMYTYGTFTVYTNNTSITMLNLYYKPSCPYCARVLAANEKIRAPLTLLDVLSATGVMAELMAKGGKTQVPFLEDTDRGISMYESADIIVYLNEHYGNGGTVCVPEAGNVCPID